MTAMPPMPRCEPVCPLCGEANACAPARSGSFETRCWCETAHFDPALLARVPAGRRGVACICAACAAGDAR